MSKIKSIVVLFLLLFSVIVNAQPNNQPFSYLDKLEIEGYKEKYLLVELDKSTVYNKKRKNLDKDNPFFAEECEGESMTLVAICKIDYNSEKEYAIVFSTCPGPEFVIYNSENPNEIIGQINADKLYVNGSGKLYSSGGEGTFDVRRKFEFIGGKLKHVDQPMYYVGLKSKTMKPITVYSTTKLETIIAKLPANYEIEVLLSKKPFNQTRALYLVKTGFGLVGWSTLTAGQYKAVDVKGLVYVGD
ncbi:hypothetical protein [Reichenbachiella sp.]|uniref:hypothetical protein n=1 Tax=Reichenbachiella sp. TaxID=2184521 RepID=UPI003BAE8434